MKRITIVFLGVLLSQTAIAGDRSYGERLKYRNAVVKGQVLLGMTPREVKKAVGSPVRINRTKGAGIDEQWVYDKPSAPRYVYIDDGEVISISD